MPDPSRKGQEEEKPSSKFDLLRASQSKPSIDYSYKVLQRQVASLLHGWYYPGYFDIWVRRYMDARNVEDARKMAKRVAQGQKN
jgi:hypothetical protein